MSPRAQHCTGGRRAVCSRPKARAPLQRSKLIHLMMALRRPWPAAGRWAVRDQQQQGPVDQAVRVCVFSFCLYFIKLQRARAGFARPACMCGAARPAHSRGAASSPFGPCAFPRTHQSLCPGAQSRCVLPPCPIRPCSFTPNPALLPCSWDTRMVAAEADVARLTKGAPSFHWVSTQERSEAPSSTAGGATAMPHRTPLLVQPPPSS